MDVDAADVMVGSPTNGVRFALIQRRERSQEDVLLVRLVQPGLSAQREVHLGSDYGPDLEQLARFFGDMAVDWRGRRGRASSSRWSRM